MSKLVYERMRDSLEKLPPQEEAAGWNPAASLTKGRSRACLVTYASGELLAGESGEFLAGVDKKIYVARNIEAQLAIASRLGT